MTVLFQTADFGGSFKQLVGNRYRRHDGEPHIADLTELCPQSLDALVETLRKLQQMVFLPVETGHAILMTIDGDVDLSHRITCSS